MNNPDKKKTVPEVAIPTSKEILENFASGKMAGRDLSRANLKKALLAGAKFSKTNLSRARLAKADLRGADLSGADLSRADLKGADLREVNLEGADLTKATLEGADLSGARAAEAVFVGAVLRGVKWHGAKAPSAKFSGALLSKCEGKDVLFRQADFEGAEAVESTWEKTDFTGADFSRSVWQNSGFDHCKLDEISGEEADLSLCAIQDCSFRKSAFPKGDFSNTLIERSSFDDTDLHDALFAVSEHIQVDFGGATLTGAGFKSVLGYSEEELAAFKERGAKVDRFVARRVIRRIRASRPLQALILVALSVLVLSVWAWFHNPENWSFEKLDRNAQRARSHRSLDEARSYFEIILKKYPENPIRIAHGKNQLGYLALEMGEPKKARSIFEDVAAMFPDQENAVIIAELGLADSYRDEDKYDKAVSMYQEFAEKWKDFPQAVDAWDRIAKVYANTGRADEATELYELIISKYASDSGAILRAEFDVAHLLRDQGRYQAARAKFLAMLERYAEVPQTAARAMVGVIQTLVLLDKLEQADKTLQDMKARYPEQVEAGLDAVIFIANAEAQARDPEKAEARYLRLMEEHGKSMQALWAGSRLAALYSSLSRNDDALKVYDGLLRKYRNDPGNRNQLKIERAQLLVQMKHYDEAIAAMEAVALEAEDENHRRNATILLGRIYLLDKRVEKARETFITLAQAYPEREEAQVASYLGLGSIEKERGDYDAAVEYFRKAVVASTQDVVRFDAYSWIRRTYQAAGNLKKEKETLRGMREIFGKDPRRLAQVKLALAEVYKREGDTEAAIEVLRSVADEDDPNRAIAALNGLLRLYAESDRSEDARRLADEIARRFPGNKVAILSARLDQAGGLYRQGRKEEAFAIYQKVAEAGDARRRQQALSAIMNYYVEKGDFSQVQSTYDLIVGDFSDAPEVVFNARLTLANALRGQGAPARALDIFREMEAESPKNQELAWTLDGMASAYLDLRDFDKARGIYQRLIGEFGGKEYPDMAHVAHLGLAAVYETQRDYKAAVKEYETAIELARNPHALSQTRAALIRVSAQMGNIDQAEAMTRDMEKNFPKRRDVIEQAWFSVATALSVQGRRSEAIRRYEKIAADSKAPGNRSRALSAIARIYADTGRRKEALASYRKLIEEFSDDSRTVENARFDMARIYRDAGRLDEADRIYREIAEAGGDAGTRIQAMAALANLAVTQGRLGAADQMYADMLEAFPDRKEARLEANRGRGNILRMQGRYEEALAAYRKNVEPVFHEGVRVEALSQIAAIHAEQGRFDLARQAYEELERLSSGSSGLRLNRLMGEGRVLQQNQRYKEALARFQEAAQSATDEANRSGAELAVAQTLAQLGDKPLALEHYDRLMLSYPENSSIRAQARSGKAEVERSRKNYENALGLYEEVVEEAQEEGARLAALSAMAQIHIEQKDFPKALDRYNRITREFSGNDTARLDALMGLGNVYQQIGKDAKALAAFGRIKAEAHDENRRIWADTAIAQLHVVRRKFDKAISVYQSVLKNYPENRQARITAEMGMANCFKEQRRFPEALEAFNRFLENFPQSPQAYWAMMGIAQIMGQQGDLEAATDKYKEISERFPQNTQQSGDSKMNMCNLLRNGSRKPEAMKCYREIVDRFPNTRQAATALESMAQLHSEDRKMDEARATYGRLIEDFSDQPELMRQARFGLAGLLAMEGKNREALAEYEKLLENAGDEGQTVQAYSAIAQTHLALGEAEKAVVIFDKLIQDYKNRPQVLWQAKMGKGQVFMSKREYKRARDIFQKVAKAAGADYAGNNALQSLARARIELGEWKRVEEVVTQLKKRYPLDFNGVINVRMALANKMRAEGRLREALAQLEPVIKNYAGQPQTAWAMIGKAQILSGMGELEASNAVYTEIFEKYTSNLTAVIDAHMGLAKNHAAQEEWKKAVVAYDQVADTWPDYPQAADALAAVAQIHQQAGFDGEVEKTLKKLIALKVGDPNAKANALINLASLYARQRRVTQAVEEYGRVYKEYPETSQAAWAMISAARLLNDGGEQARAVKLFEEVIAEYPEDHEVVIGAKEALETIFRR